MRQTCIDLLSSGKNLASDDCAALRASNGGRDFTTQGELKDFVNFPGGGNTSQFEYF